MFLLFLFCILLIWTLVLVIVTLLILNFTALFACLFFHLKSSHVG